MELQFLRAWLLSWILISLWVGPATLLVAHRTLHKGWIFGIITGFGIALADVIYAILSRIGLVYLDDFVAEYQFWFQFTVSMLFIIIGLYIFFFHSRHEKSFHVKKSYFKNFITWFAINIVNVITILLFAIIFAKLIPLEVHTAMAEVFLILWIAIGAWIWRISLSYVLSHFKVKLEKIYILNKILWWLIFLWWIATLIKLFL